MSVRGILLLMPAATAWQTTFALLTGYGLSDWQFYVMMVVMIAVDVYIKIIAEEGLLR